MGLEVLSAGHHPILMDFGIIGGVNPPDPSAASPGLPSYNAFEPARYAMGDTLRYADRMDLISMEPRGDLSSTGYALANPGVEYLVLQPGEDAGPFTVKLGVGTFLVEWFNVNKGENQDTGQVTVDTERSMSFTTPFVEPGPTVLYLKRTGQ